MFRRLLAIGLLLSLAGMVQAATVNFSLDSKTVTPTTAIETPTPFTLSVFISNTSPSQTVQFTGFDVYLTFSPQIPAGEIKLLSRSLPSTSGITVSSSPTPGSFLTDSIFLTSGNELGTVNTLAPNETKELIRLNLEFEPDPALANYAITFALFDLTDSDGNDAASFTATNGFVASPEPSALCLLAVGALGLLRRRRA